MKGLKMKKSILTLFAVISLVLLGSNSAFAGVAGSSGSYQLLDNDHGAINSSYNGYYHTWTYGYYGNDYNGDHRIANTSGAEYQWQFAERSSSSRQYWAYLRHPDFVNPSAAYYLWSQNNLTGGQAAAIHVGSINQNTAYPGWNKIGSQRSYSYDWNNFRVMIINTSYKTGADAAEVDFY